MIVAIAGGNLQGVEATYLASKAGWTTLVMDKRALVPASGLCDHFFHLDVHNEAALLDAVRGADFILPALENQSALNALVCFSQKYEIPLAFDARAYAISSSKVTSDALFKKKNIPAPLPWPRCGFPAVGKPDNDSGSQGVTLFYTPKQYEQFLEKFGKRPDVLQEYVEGPSYSMEVMGMSGNYIALQSTQLFMDDIHDCCRVTAPVPLFQEVDDELVNVSLELARAIDLEGIMDVEVIQHKGCLKVLEIDARLPSQTPTAVFHSTGINMVALLGDIFVHKLLNPPHICQRPAWVSYEHVAVSNQGLLFQGEHIMSISEPLKLIRNLFGADEVITNYQQGRREFVATLIIKASSEQELEKKRKGVLKSIAEHIDLF
ncbi:pyrrolysine biosynthesis protein PylC [Desulfocicer vacuolatum DSM 3385]|uniref:Pyrrolysine biosynthesis protein PylC n=1 Tax=Desulfocicer vacuolatum DSM 3385 TaxID=1121400 RepID=A0A1W2CRP5_9BACT|nr:3-methylornithine--L-lysine ligase PylC [Desulfocicer vacuolatum]SMC87338.1 pyrrolysine biosynthesis protein PylC [Desulfocicer vacuolatum DSM 3385]